MKVKKSDQHRVIVIAVVLLAVTGTMLCTADEKTCVQDQVSIRLSAPDGFLYDDYSHFKFYGAQQMGVQPKYLAHVFLECPSDKDYKSAFTLMPSKGICEGLQIPGSPCSIKRIELAESE